MLPSLSSMAMVSCSRESRQKILGKLGVILLAMPTAILNLELSHAITSLSLARTTTSALWPVASFVMPHRTHTVWELVLKQHLVHACMNPQQRAKHIKNIPLNLNVIPQPGLSAVKANEMENKIMPLVVIESFCLSEIVRKFLHKLQKFD